MGNSFNISVAPQIAALNSKIDIIDTQVDAVRAVNFPATNTLITTVDTVIDDIHDTDIPGTNSKIDVTDTLVTSSTTTTFISASDTLLHSNDAQSDTDNIAYEKAKEIIVTFKGVFRAYFEFRNYNINQDSWAKIYINGIAVGVEKYYNGDAFTPFTDDNSVLPGDLVQLYLKGTAGYAKVMCQNFRLKGTIYLYAYTTLSVL